MHKTNALTLYKVKDKFIDGLAIQTANKLRSSFAQAECEEDFVLASLRQSARNGLSQGKQRVLA